MANVYSKGSADAAAAKSFLHDLTCIAGFRSNNQRTNGPLAFTSKQAAAATALCNEVINRSFNDVDAAIFSLSGTYVKAHLTKPRAADRAWWSEDIATALVYLAECLNIYWNDLNATTYEVNAFKKTILGKKVEEYGRFASTLQNAAANAPTTTGIPTKTSRAPKAKASTTNTGAVKSTYKSTGPQSSKIRDLQGTPGTKVYANGPLVYKIVGTNASSKNTPSVFVRPISASGATGSTNKIFVNSGNGYTDCTCWFDDPNEANDFLAKVLSNCTIQAGISNLHVAKAKADQNGYFMIGTEYGVCAIQASKLNEALEEDLIENFDTENTVWDRAYADASDDDKQELNYYMRKG